MSEVASRQETYNARSGEAIDGYIEVLSEPPKRPLNEEQKTQFYKFREELLFGQVVTGDGTEINARPHGEQESLEDIVKNFRYADKKHEISIDYFLTDEGKNLLASKGLLEPFGVDEVMSAKQLRSGFMKHATGLGQNVLQELADAGKEAVDQKLATDLVDKNELTPPDRLFVFEDGTNLARRIEGLTAYRHFFRNVGSLLKKELRDTGDDVLIAAKLAITEIYLKQVNGEIAEAYPDVFIFLEQTSKLGDERSIMLVEAFANLLPGVINKDTDFEVRRRGRFMVRLDRVRNGASRDVNGRFTAVSPELEEYLDSQKAMERGKESPVFSQEEVEILSKVRYNADQMLDFATQVMAGFGILSKYSPEKDAKYRSNRAADGLWQVMIEDVEAMTADDPQGVFEIPRNFNRTLTKSTAPVGVIPGVAHELQHANQQDNIRNSPGGLGIGKSIFGRRNDAFFESGAIRVEQIIQKRLFGQSRGDSPHYLRALAAIESGANEAEACKVFYNSYCKDNPLETPLAAAKIAVSRVMRLARRYGGYNSQPLNYSESGLLLNKTKNLPENVQSILFDNGALEIQDLARLYEFDLLPKNTKPFPFDRFIDIVTPILRGHINDSKKVSE